VTERADDLQAASALPAPVGPPGKRRLVPGIDDGQHDLARAPKQAEPQHARITVRQAGPGAVQDGIDDELVDDHLGVVRQRLQAPARQQLPDEPPGGPGLFRPGAQGAGGDRRGLPPGRRHRQQPRHSV